MYGIVIARKIDNGDFIGIFSKEEEWNLLKSEERLVVSDLCSIGSLEYIIENNNLESDIDSLKRTIQVLESTEEPLDSPVVYRFIERVKPRLLKSMLNDLTEDKLNTLKNLANTPKEGNSNMVTLVTTIDGISFSQDLVKSVFNRLDI